MKQSEAWEMEYCEDRYLRYASNAQLKERTFDIVNNSFVRTSDDKIGFLPPNEGGQFWLSSMSHVMEECRLRGCDRPSIASYASELKADLRPIPGVDTRIAARGLKDRTLLVKFGERRHSEQALRYGRIRIGSASSFDNDAYRRAIRDRELVRTTFHRPKDVAIFVPGKHFMTPEGGLAIAHRAPTDYFMYCFSMSYQRRLFDDFRADSCLLIFNNTEFANRLDKAVSAALPSYGFRGQNIGYFDPFRAPTELDVPFNKPFAFEYQREARFVWLPPQSQVALEPFFVTLGSLEDVAELVT